MGLDIRTISGEEFPAYIRAVDGAFIGTMEDVDVALERAVADPARCFAAVEDGAFVGGAYDTALPIVVPGGGPVTAAAVIGVGVLPTHTRRGVNTALMRAQLDAAHARGDALAILHASEGGIYGRYGYGLASLEIRGDLERAHAGFVRGVESVGRVRILGREDAREAVEAIEANLRPRTPGMVEAVGPGWFDYRFPVRHHGEDQHLQFAVHETDGVVDAFAAYAMQHEWTESISRSILDVWQILGATPAGYAAMWRYVLGIDLVERVRAHRRPSDDPILHLLADPRRFRGRVLDGLWLRLVDLPRALAERGYAGDGAAVIEVLDRFCPWNEGRYRVEVEAGAARCVPTDERADLACTTNEVAAAYLGGTSFRQLAAAARVVEVREGGIARADALFATAGDPWCQVMF